MKLSLDQTCWQRNYEIRKRIGFIFGFSLDSFNDANYLNIPSNLYSVL